MTSRRRKTFGSGVKIIIFNYQWSLFSFPVPLNAISGAHYVDPSNYESVKILMNKNTMKLNEKYLKTDEIIGEGNQLLKS